MINTKEILRLSLFNSHNSHSSHSDHSSHSNHSNTDAQNWDTSKLAGISFPGTDDVLSAQKYQNLMKNLNIIRSAVGLSQGNTDVSGIAVASEYNRFKLQLKKGTKQGTAGGTYYNGLTEGGTDWIDIPGNATSKQSLLTDVLGYSTIQSKILAAKNTGIPVHASHSNHANHNSHSNHDNHDSHSSHDSHDSHGSTSHSSHNSHGSTAANSTYNASIYISNLGSDYGSQYSSPFKSTDSCYRT